MTSDATSAAGKGSTFFQPSKAAPPTAAVSVTGLATRAKAVPGFELANLMQVDSAAMEQVVIGLLAALKNRPESEIQAGELHKDGGFAISSQVAVWLVGQVSGAYGRKLLRLSTMKEPAKLRSTRGLSELLSGAIQDHLGTGTS